MDMEPRGKQEVLPPVEEETGEQWPLLIPGSTEPYQVLGSAEAWVEAFKDMGERIKSSPKHSQLERNNKLVALLEVNKPLYETLTKEQQMEVMSV